MYPIVATFGGKGGGVAHNEIELYEIVQRGISASMVGQVLIEEYVGDWKQIEYEVMRDNADNSVIVCNMENVLSMRVHTGDNVVVAPSQTINNQEYHEMRLAALDAIRYVISSVSATYNMHLDTHLAPFGRLSSRLDKTNPSLPVSSMRIDF